MPPALPIITLLTDFGERDYFVASMKGVILTINPSACIIDLAHQIAPHAIAEAGYCLRSCYHYFPEGTIHVAVVDPGVGTTRRALLVSTARYFFIGPDNGLLHQVLEREADVEIRHIEHAQYRLRTAGSTFDGRDVFAPAAAWLSKGVLPGSFGRLIHDPVRGPQSVPEWNHGQLIGRIEYVDRFGNLISNVTAKHLDEVRAVSKRPTIRIRIGRHTIEGLVASYEESAADRPCALINSDAHVEIVLKQASASESLGIGRGETIAVF
jgi:S-adenosylmethionine hydrolase